MTIADPRWRSRLKEITRLRELFRDAYFGGGVYDGSLETLDGYFLSFAILARQSREMS